MINSRERGLLLRWSGNVLGMVGADSAEALELVDWLAAHAEELGLAPIDVGAAAEGAGLPGLAKLLQATDVEAGEGDRTSRRLTQLAAVVGLDAQESAALELLLRYETEPLAQTMVDVVCGSRRGGLNLREPALGWLLGICPSAAQRLFGRGERLVRSGLVNVDEDQAVTLVRRLSRLMWSSEEVDVRRLLLGGEDDGALDWSDFEHLGAARSDVERLLRGAAEQGAEGVNILVYGPPGTGKTAFCQTLAKHLGLALFSVGESGGDGDEPLRSERLSELVLAQSLLAADTGALLLFDEMEDLLVGAGDAGAFGFAPQPASGASRVFLHRLLERAPTPTLWTIHDAEMVHPAVLRRMMYAIRMQPPPVSVRTRIWSRQLSLHDIDATDSDARDFAREFDASPGLAAAATAAAHIGQGGLAEVRRGVQSLSAAMGQELHPRRNALAPAGGDGVRFDPMLIEADIDLVALAERLAEAGAPARRESGTGDHEGRPYGPVAFSICLQGPAGTGKTASLHYLAERLELDLEQVRATELLGMWQGETERNIADAFASAAEQGTFLVIDQAETLLAERHASMGWELNAANELLAWMESHPLPFACTARDDLRLDQVALRRFVFRCVFGFLGQAAAARAFRLWFGREPAAALRLPTSLTPGDFTVVRRRATLLRQLDDDAALVEMLREECRIAPPRGRSLGFGADRDRARHLGGPMRELPVPRLLAP